MQVEVVVLFVHNRSNAALCKSGIAKGKLLFGQHKDFKVQIKVKGSVKPRNPRAYYYYVIFFKFHDNTSGKE